MYMKKINGVTVEVLCGDITRISTGALVVPEYCDRIADTPLVKRLFYCGGDDSLEFYTAYAKNVKLEAGCVVVTVAGGNAKYLFHVSTRDCDAETFKNDLKVSIYNVLRYARRLKVKSLAVPDFCLNKDCPLTQAEMVQVMLEVLDQFPKAETAVKEFTIVLSKGGEDYRKAADVLEKESYKACPV